MPQINTGLLTENSSFAIIQENQLFDKGRPMEFTKEQSRALETLMEECGIKTEKELLDNALTLLAWAVKEVSTGRAIASVNEHENKYKEILLPALENVMLKRTANPVDPNPSGPSPNQT